MADLPATAVDRRQAQGPVRHRSVAAMAILLTVAVLLVAAVGSAFSGHDHPSGLGPVIWLIWVAIADWYGAQKD